MSSISTIVANEREMVSQPAARTTLISGLIDRLKSKAHSRPNQGAVRPVTASKARLGEAVNHPGYGNGIVTARWPDGRLQVRFQRKARNRLVWPSHVDRAV